MMRQLNLLLLCPILLLSTQFVRADNFTTKMEEQLAPRILPINDWKYSPNDTPANSVENLNDSAWPAVHPGFVWHGEGSKVWFRTKLIVPANVNNITTAGASLRLYIGMNDDGEVYADGKDLGFFHWDEGNFLITNHASPGQVIQLAVRGINGPGDGGLHFSHIAFGAPGAWRPTFRLLQQELNFYTLLAPQLPVSEEARVRLAIQQAEAAFNPDDLATIPVDQSSELLEKARQSLLPLASIVKGFHIYYVGHAHIDMNWLWTWPDTIDTCKRTWSSAMLLMHSFPDFNFVQSQPAAYVPIQHLYPQEFSQIADEIAHKQWDPVSGFWDESDTNMPSGEGLARSLFLGQRYFHRHFGRYAVTGWLPDSFGHSWQLPQLMRLAGMNSFYHMRCGDGIRFSWWESPDGSRVLKANTDNYDEPIDVSQLARPWRNLQHYGIKRALVVFGVGDHGGGPTRQQILEGKSLQDDPLLPRLQFCSADTFFSILRHDPASHNLPVIDHDLQYTFTGCYTTHADIKKAVRRNENDIYSSEVFSSLADMVGKPYPTVDFDRAWEPTAFAQFHDIMCGTAIHSTYTWMKGLLKPADKWAVAQRSEALQALTKSANTSGAHPGEKTVAVWNPLSFTRTDLVRIQTPNAESYHSVRDAEGKIFPAQAENSNTLDFIAHSVPAFSHGIYFLNTHSCPLTPYSPLLIQQRDGSYTLTNNILRLQIDGRTGLFTQLRDLIHHRDLIQPEKPANRLELLEDKGNAWDINFTGKRTDIALQGLHIQPTAFGPLFATLQVQHSLGASTYTQWITLYNGLNRVNVKNRVNWQEHDEMLKAAFDFNMQRPELRVGIPYGSISRPDTGQENPGQKWMDMTDYTQPTVKGEIPIPLNSLFNNDSSLNFDSQGRGYPRDQFPASGLIIAAEQPVTFHVHGNIPGLDNISCTGQTFSVPSFRQGSVLYLLGASAPGDQEGDVLLHISNGKVLTKHIGFNDWVAGARSDNLPAFRTSYRTAENGKARDSNRATLWMIHISIPSDLKLMKVTLPDAPKMHIFAAATATVSNGKPIYGVTILNDCKYGSDANGSVFRLSLLRSTHSPDPHPDEGQQIFSYALHPHTGDWRNGLSEQEGLAYNIPLFGELSNPHRASYFPPLSFKLTTMSGADDLEAGALKHSENGKGYILRFFETWGRNTTAKLVFSRPVEATETDILERPISGHIWKGKTLFIPVGHDRIVTLHLLGLPDKGVEPPHAGKLADWWKP